METTINHPQATIRAIGAASSLNDAHFDRIEIQEQADARLSKKPASAISHFGIDADCEEHSAHTERERNASTAAKGKQTFGTTPINVPSTTEDFALDADIRTDMGFVSGSIDKRDNNISLLQSTVAKLNRVTLLGLVGAPEPGGSWIALCDVVPWSGEFALVSGLCKPTNLPSMGYEPKILP